MFGIGRNKQQLRAIRSRIFQTMVGFDVKLVPLGHRALSAGWRGALDRWLSGGDTRTWVVRKGRRIGASTIVAPRLAVAWVICCIDGLKLPPGETVVVGFVSIGREEAGDRLAQVEAVLTALGMPYDARPSAGEIALRGLPVVFKVITRNWRTSVGRTIGFLWCDEVARWEDADTSANPATEVISSLMPSTATIPTSLVALVSSPWSESDYHAERYDRGDTDAQTTAFLPTWVGNPTLTESDTHAIEEDPKIWAREYGAVPGGTITQALDSEDVKAAFEEIDEPAHIGKIYCSIDASSLMGDGFAWLFGAGSSVGLLVAGVDAVEGLALRLHSMQSIVDKISKACKEDDVKQVFGDQRESASLESMFSQKHLRFTSYAWSEPSKDAAFQLLRRLLRERKLHIEPHAGLRKEMLSCKAHLRPSGRTHYATNGLDYLSALVTMCHAIVAGEIDAEPVPRDRRVPRFQSGNPCMAKWYGTGRGFG